MGPLPQAFGKQMLAAKGAWGWGLRREMMDYNHWASFGMLGEILPSEDNTVTISEDKDRFGLPVAHVTFNLHDNDKKLIAAGRKKTEEVMWAAGAAEVSQEARYGAPRRGLPDGRRRAQLGRGQVRPHARYRQPVRVRWQRVSNAGLCESGTDDPGSGRAHGGLPDLAGGPPSSAATTAT